MSSARPLPAAVRSVPRTLARPWSIRVHEISASACIIGPCAGDLRSATCAVVGSPSALHTHRTSPRAPPGAKASVSNTFPAYSPPPPLTRMQVACNTAWYIGSNPNMIYSMQNANAWSRNFKSHNASHPLLKTPPIVFVYPMLACSPAHRTSQASEKGNMP